MVRISKPPQRPPDGEIYLTTEQAASYSRLEVSSIMAFIHSGKLKAYRVAGKKTVLICRSELLDVLGR